MNLKWLLSGLVSIAAIDAGLADDSGSESERDLLAGSESVKVASDTQIAAVNFINGDIAYMNSAYMLAADLFRLSADKGVIPAIHGLARAYERGEGVPQNYVEAIKLYHLAAKKDSVSSQIALGRMYVYGLGVYEDSTEAFRWFRLAAENDSDVAQTIVGMMYRDGDGVPIDPVQAYMWVNIASAKENARAIEIRKELQASLSPSQIAEAQRLSSDWFENHRLRKESLK